jgi:hypothetical protein
VELATDLWVGALLRRVAGEGAFAVVARRGDRAAGAVLVKAVNRRDGSVRLFAEARRGEGEAVWMQPRPGASEPELDQYAERQARIDPDLWVVEIEDAQGRHFLTEPVDGD